MNVVSLTPDSNVLNKKKALITGITGQDGSYLAEFLLNKGYQVHGIKRRASSFNSSRIDHLYQDPHVSNPSLVLHYGDLTDSTNLIRIIQQVQPEEIYNLGAQSHVAVSLIALNTLRTVMLLVLFAYWRLSEFWDLQNNANLSASTSELYGLVQEIPRKKPHLFIHVAPMG